MSTMWAIDFKRASTFLRILKHVGFSETETEHKRTKKLSVKPRILIRKYVCSFCHWKNTLFIQLFLLLLLALLIFFSSFEMYAHFKNAVTAWSEIETQRRKWKDCVVMLLGISNYVRTINLRQVVLISLYLSHAACVGLTKCTERICCAAVRRLNSVLEISGFWV